jgi:hypothetical protein
MKNEKLTNYAVIDTTTGEIGQYLTAKEKNMLDDRYTTANPSNDSKCNDTDCRKNADLFYQYINETCGNFYFNYYENINYSQYIFRFIYLCTFMNYKNYLEYGNSKDENKLMIKKDLFEVLRLSDRETYNTIKYLTENNFIEISEKYIKVNDDYCKKGNITTNKNKGVIRMFDNAIREIYENALPKEHKKLSLLIKILPLVHFSTNVICRDAKQEIIDLVDYYTLTELADELGYSTTQKLKKGLMDIKVKGQPAIMISKINNKDMLVVNPLIYYKGNDMKSMEGIVNLFKMAR